MVGPCRRMLEQRDGRAKEMDGSKGLLDHRNAWTRGIAGPERCLAKEMPGPEGWLAAPVGWLGTRGMAGAEGCLDKRDGWSRGKAGPGLDKRDGWSRGMVRPGLDNRDGWNRWMSGSEGWLEQRDG
jgi:hypothetical protein